MEARARELHPILGRLLTSSLTFYLLSAEPRLMKKWKGGGAFGLQPHFPRGFIYNSSHNHTQEESRDNLINPRTRGMPVPINLATPASIGPSHIESTARVRHGWAPTRQQPQPAGLPPLD